jgi:4-hydroxybutyryl-CoA dehydratase/vinylacetyl-CoA-Delta-isomerase
MGLRKPEQFLSSLKDGREVYYRGKLVEDVASHPVLQIGVQTALVDYEITENEEYMDFAVAIENGEEINRFLYAPRTKEDLLKRMQLIETGSRLCRGFPPFAKEGGSDALNAARVASKYVDEKYGTCYNERVEAFARHLQEHDLSLAIGMTDVKGDRSLRPSQQADQDLYLRIVEDRPDGIVVRGAKAHMTAVQYANEIIILPTRAMSEADKDYAVAFAIPVNTKGIKMISRAGAYEDRPLKEVPISGLFDIMDALVVFDDVFIPKERVFLKGEWEFAGLFTKMFANFHRMTASAYKYPFIELMIGAAKLMADYNGTSKTGHAKEKISELILYGETLKALTRSACENPVEDKLTGIVYPNPTISNAAKYHFANHYHQMVKYLQDISGGIIVTLPTEDDFENEELRPFILKYLAGNASIEPEHRYRLIRLIHDMVASDMGGFWEVTTIHAEGSLMALRLAVFAEADFTIYESAARNAAGIVSEPIISGAK